MRVFVNIIKFREGKKKGKGGKEKEVSLIQPRITASHCSTQIIQLGNGGGASGRSVQMIEEKKRRGEKERGGREERSNRVNAYRTGAILSQIWKDLVKGVVREEREKGAVGSAVPRA